MTRRRTIKPEPVMAPPESEPTKEPAMDTATAPDEVIAPTKAEKKAAMQRAAQIAAGLTVPGPTLPPSAAAWRLLSEQAAQLAVLAAGIADLGEAV